MGKTHRKVNAGSCSIDYHSPHNRGFAKDKKAYSHHRLRTHNKGCNEDSIEVFNCKQKKMNTHWAASYYGESSNIPNKQGLNITDEDLYNGSKYKWSISEQTMSDSLNTIITRSDNENVEFIEYIKSSKKQLERRGVIGEFYGHRQ